MMYSLLHLLVTIPSGNITDVVLISASPAELLPAMLIVYVPNWLGQYCHVVEDVMFWVTSSPP